MSLIGRIAAVHVVYRECCERIYWFGQLTSHSPGVLEGLVQSVGETTGIDNCMVRATPHSSELEVAIECFSSDGVRVTCDPL